MTRNSAELLLLGSLLAFVFVVAACGGDDDVVLVVERSDTRRRNAHARRARRAARSRSARRVRRRLPRPGPDVLHRSATVVYATNRPLYTFKPGRASTRCRTSPTASRRSPRTRRPSRSRSRRREVRPAGQPRGHLQGRQVRLRALHRPSRSSGQYPGYFSVDRGRAVRSRPTASRTISGIRRRTTRRSSSSSRRRTGVAVAVALVMPITMPVPEEYAKKYDAKTPSTYNTHVVATGPYMVKNDAEGNRPATSRASRSTSSATRTGMPRPTTSPAYLDEINWTTNDDRRVARGAARAQRLAHGRSTPTRRPPSSRRPSRSYKDQYQQVPGGGWRYFPLNTTIKPLDNVNVRKAIIAGVRPRRRAQGARRQVHRRHPDALPAAGPPGLRGGRRHEGPGLRLHELPARRHRSSRPST